MNMVMIRRQLPYRWNYYREHAGMLTFLREAKHLAQDTNKLTH